MLMLLCCDITHSLLFLFFFFKQKTAYEMRISDWSSDVCSSDLQGHPPVQRGVRAGGRAHPGVHEGTEGAGPADGRRDKHPARGRRAAVHLSRLPDDRREEIAGTARRSTAQGQPERHVAAALRAPFLALADARDLRPPDAARQDAATPARSGRLRWPWHRSEEHTSELQSLMRTSYAVF